MREAMEEAGEAKTARQRRAATKREQFEHGYDIWQGEP
jgi:hypothetical protein